MNDPTFVQLHPDTARRTRPSCTLLLDRRTEFTAEFHSNLVELMPDVQVIAQPPGTKISQPLVDCVLWATFTTDSPVVVGNTLQDIGLGLHRSGFPREGYQSVGHALLRTVRRMYPMDWSGGMTSVWIRYHAWLCDHWMRGALAGVIENQDRVATNDMDAPATREAVAYVAHHVPVWAYYAYGLTGSSFPSSLLALTRDRYVRIVEQIIVLYSHLFINHKEAKLFSDEVVALLSKRITGVITTLLPDGSPHSVIAGVVIEGDELVSHTGPGAKRLKNLRGDPRINVLAIDPDTPMRYAEFRGTATIEEVSGADLFETFKDHAKKYDLPEEAGRVAPEATVVKIRIRPEKIGYHDLDPSRMGPEKLQRGPR